MLKCVFYDSGSTCIMLIILNRLYFATNYFVDTVKLVYNELGYNELPIIANKKKSLVGLGDLTSLFSWL